MDKENEILKELEEISPTLCQIQKVNVFEVPENYFEELTEKLTLFTLLNVNEKSAFIPEKNMTFSEMRDIPEGYFNSLSDRILSKIKNSEAQIEEEELINSFPVLYSLKGKNVFSIPPNYFQDLESIILNKINNKPEAKVVSIQSKWWKYAAAAVVTGVIAVSSLFIFSDHSKVTVNTTASVTSTKIPDYIQSSFKYKTPEQVDEGIASLSDDEIIRYLEKHGSIIDNDLLTKGVDVKELPSTNDYLTDENTLNDYLQKIDAKNANQNTP